MRTIWKYRIAITDEQTIEAPAGAKIIYVGLDAEDHPAVWCELDAAEKQLEEIKLHVVGTGNPVPAEAGRHLGSFTWKLTGTVWHLFTHGEKKNLNRNPNKIGA